MSLSFAKATKKAAKLRMALIGPSGAGKTYTALAIGTSLGEKVAFIDTEHGSASKYAGRDGFNFDVLELDSFHPQTYIDAIKAAEQAGYDVLVIDSLSHAWMGKDGALELVDKAAKRSQSTNTFAAWRDVTPLHNALVEVMIQSRSDPFAGIKEVITGLRSDAARFRMDAISLRTQSLLNAHNAWMSGIDLGGASEAKDAAWWSDCRADQLERELKSLVRHLEAQDETR